MRKLSTMPRSFPEQSFGRALWVAIVVLNLLLAAVATVLCASALTQSVEHPHPLLGVLIAVPVMWWVMALTLLLTTMSRRRASATSIGEASATVPGGILLRGSRLVPSTTLAAAVAAALTLTVLAVTVHGGWRIVCALGALLLLGTIVSHVISLRHPRRLLLHPLGLGSATFHLDAEVRWDDIDSIDYGVGMNNVMVLRIGVRPGAPSYREQWRHPFFRRRGAIDVDPVALGIDGTLLWLALRLYRLEPSAREELRGGRVPERLIDARAAVATTPEHVASPVLARFRPAPAAGQRTAP
ncbi:hypothetical protein ACIPV2_08865 [Microbacterium sp. NPDC089987]|uniref:hypothetical protein n=1 Tax=Microbacterium sp. NPDC089987 TaxID=3364202 RepID=UPI0038244587